jgi:L-seryl-tRNA(Ser) seleniumtransferase
MTSSLRDLPSVDSLLREPRVELLVAEYSHEQVVAGVRAVLADCRERARATNEWSRPSTERLIDELTHRIEATSRPALRRVVNGTGVIVHTNLGRAPLSAAALEALERVARGYSNLEYDLGAGQRGSRHEHVTSMLRTLTGAESALVLNNNAAGLLLVLSTLAQEREVVISRGQLVEIGGGFRIPDVLRQSGARLIEVGTTNRTYASDYQRALGPETALLLRVHSSNFRVIGFVHEPSLDELATLAHEGGHWLVDDLGSGSLLDTSAFGLRREPMVQESVAAGADLVAFSGDKLLGGPQCGIVVGRAELIDRLKRHPLTRALRPDKLTLAALGATLQHYLRGEAVECVPVWRMIAASPVSIEARASRLARLLPPGYSATLLDGQSAIGGGALPGELLPTRLLALQGPISADRLALSLRNADPPIVGRIERGSFALDLRTVLPEEDELLLETFSGALQRGLS